MRQNYRRSNPMFWLVIMLGISVFFSGCTKQRAKMAVNKSKKILTEAEQQEAEKYKPDLLEQSRRRLDEAESQMANRDYARALESAKATVTIARQTLEEAKINRAADKLNQAKIAIDIANTNDGSKEDAERYKRIIELYNDAQQKQNKNKWDDVIQLSETVIQEVDILLQRLKNQAERQLNDAQNSLKSLQAEGAESYAPESIIEVEDLVNKVGKLITETREYISAINTAEYAIRKAEEGVIKTKNRKSQEKLKKIESDLALAIEKGAEIYARDMLEKTNTTFEAMVKDYFAKNYDRVLNAAPLLEHEVAELLETTKRKAAEAKIKAVENAIKELVDGGAKEYLPGRVELIEQNLVNAKQQYDQKLYEEAETICLIALDEIDRIRGDFNDLALEAMRNATEALNIAQDVFQQMEHIFIVKTLPTMSTLERDFENSKNALKQELNTFIQNSRVNLGIAKVRQEDQQYKRSIEISSEVRRTAQYILQETYHVVAHNAIMELAQKISDYEADGGREYASKELDLTKQLLEESKTILAQGKYKEAVNKSAETRAQMEIMVQKIQKTAVDYMKEAREKLAEASKYQADKYKKADLTQTEELLNEAETRLQAQELKPAVEKALTAAGLIKSAITESTKIWAQEELTDADSKILRAEEAGSEDYAPEILDEARRLREAARQMFDEMNYLDARNLAQRSATRAMDALYKKINQAEDLLTEAKAYGGWEYNFELLSQATDLVRTSRELIESRDYITSRLYAEKAISDAEDVLKNSKVATFQQRVQQIKNTYEMTVRAGSNYFQPEQSKEVISRLGEMMSSFDVTQFDYYRKELDKIEADLNQMLSSVPETLDSIIEEEMARIEKVAPDYETINSQEIEQARQLLKYSQIDFKKGKNLQAYQELKEADSLINKMETVLKEEEYLTNVQQLINELDEVFKTYRFVLNQSESVITKVAMDPLGKSRMVAIAGNMSPVEFRQNLADLYDKATNLMPPPTMKTFHQGVVKTFNNASLAGIDFERLVILENYSVADAKKLIKQAYKHLDLVKKGEAEITDYITKQLRDNRKISGKMTI